MKCKKCKKEIPDSEKGWLGGVKYCDECAEQRNFFTMFFEKEEEQND
jgi:hypothetical protein